jgi:hypothetical protein
VPHLIIHTTPEHHDQPSLHHGKEQHHQEQDPKTQQESYNRHDPSQKKHGFFVYPEKIINNGVNACQRSNLGKIITEKPIHISSIQRGLEQIWGTPAGLKIQEIEGGILQCFMDRNYDQERVLLGNPWVFRNSWFIVKAWDRQKAPASMDFSHAPVWIQMWGLPTHCKTKEMGESLGNLLGAVESADLYEYPGKKVIIKVRVAINVYQPIQTGILIGNQKDGTHWIDYRYENLPQVCFKCGILGHEEKLCMNEALTLEGQAPLGPWIRSKQYGRRIRDDNDKQFHSNPSQGKNFGHYSPPIPASMLEQMAAMKLQEEAQEERSRQDANNEPRNNMQKPREGQCQKSMVRRSNTSLMQVQAQETMVITEHREGQLAAKRPRMEIETSPTIDTIMAGPVKQASQGQ